MGDPLRARLLGHGDVGLDPTGVQLRSRSPAYARAHHDGLTLRPRKPAGGNGEPQHLVVTAAVCGPFLCPLVR